MFTATNVDSRRVKPTEAQMEGKSLMKVVYIVLESQYQASLTKAVNAINDGPGDLAVEMVGYVLEELRDDAAFETFKEDVNSANVFIGSLIFVQELAEKVRRAAAFLLVYNYTHHHRTTNLLLPPPGRRGRRARARQP